MGLDEMHPRNLTVSKTLSLFEKSWQPWIRTQAMGKKGSIYLFLKRKTKKKTPGTLDWLTSLLPGKIMEQIHTEALLGLYGRWS